MDLPAQRGDRSLPGFGATATATAPIGRVHMVLDLKVNDWLRGFFPPEPIGDKVKNAVQKARYFGTFYAKQAAAHPALAPVKKQVKKALSRRRGATP